MGTPTVAIVGCGFGGLCMAVKLQEIGVSYTIYEKESEVGGTWFVNTYPGCTCDVASHLYCFSFELNPNWTKHFAGNKEILEYLKYVADKYKIRQNIRFNTEVGRTDWDEDKQEWTMSIKQNGVDEEVRADMVVIGTGALRIPNIPEKFVKDFKGKWAHSANWSEELPIAKKNVAIIGNGASAVQIIPSIAPKVDQLYVYQRTPSWTIVKRDFPYSDSFRRLLNWSPKLLRLYRWALFGRNELTHRIMLRNNRLSNFMARYVKRTFIRYLHKQCPDKEVAAKLQPDYEPGCKRIILSDDYYKTFMRPNVHLITDPIKEVKGSLIHTGDGTQTKVDTIIIATGFRPDLFMAPMKVHGRDGRELQDLWEKEKPQAYYGMCCNQFPNLFMLLGPNSALGHNSVIYQIECQVDAICKIIQEMKKKNIASVEVKSTVQKTFNDEIQANLASTVWNGGSCKSWYVDPEKGNFTLWPHSCIEFWRQTQRITLDSFDVVHHH